MSRIISRWRKDRTKSSSNSTILPSLYSPDGPSSPSHSTSSTSASPSSLAYNHDISMQQHRVSRGYNRNHNNRNSNVPGHIRPVTCTNFLMGGQYYPGKDKKRNFLRRKTLWYRVFCSTKLRMIASSVVCAYLVVMFALVPAMDVISQYGHLLSRREPKVVDGVKIKRAGTDGGDGDGGTSSGNISKPNQSTSLVDDAEVEYEQEEEEEEEDKQETDDHDFEEEEEEEDNEEVERLDKERKERVDAEKRQKAKEEEELNIEKENVRKEQEMKIKLNIKSLDLMKQEAKILDKKLDESQNNPDRMKEQDEILHKIVPKFHDAATAAKEVVQSDKKEKASSLISPELQERTLLNQAIHYKHSSCPKHGTESKSISLVMQTTFDRLPLLRLTCQRWKSSPLIVAVYLNQNEYDNKWNDILSEYEKLCNNNIVLLSHISKSHEERTLKYPINILRNEALDRVVSSHVLVIDIDMIPSDNLDSAILDTIDLAIERRMDDDGDAGIDPKDAIVVPAFERKEMGGIECDTLEKCQEYMKDDKFIPRTMIELKEKIVNDECIVFQSDVNQEGHMSTKTNEWIERSYDSSSSYGGLEEIECFKSLRYEPYVIIPWCALKSNADQLIMRSPGPRSPYYDERFFGYGKNKIQQIAHLRTRAYQFMVMPPTGFITHFPHPISNTKKIWNDTENFDLHADMDKLYPKYLEELEKMYPYATPYTKLCQQKKKNHKGEN